MIIFLAENLKSLGKYKESIATAEKALALDPKSVNALYCKGTNFIKY